MRAAVAERCRFGEEWDRAVSSIWPLCLAMLARSDHRSPGRITAGPHREAGSAQAVEEGTVLINVVGFGHLAVEVSGDSRAVASPRKNSTRFPTARTHPLRAALLSRHGAQGVAADGHREVLDFAVGGCEDGAFWPPACAPGPAR